MDRSQNRAEFVFDVEHRRRHLRDSVHYNGGLPGLSAIGSVIRETESGDAESEWDDLREQSTRN
jgi:hypothetical protein